MVNKLKAPYFDSTYRPDFFKFLDKEVKIVELSGFDDGNYIARLKDKEANYHRIIEQNNKRKIKFSYERFNPVQNKENKN